MEQRNKISLPQPNKSKDIIPTVLAIAGSDPAGGAGIQADLKTMTALGVYGAAAITCLTVQNSKGVTRVEPVAPDLVRAQVMAVLEDHYVSHVKIGMVATTALAHTIGHLLQEFVGEVIYDPVLASTTGQSLFQATASGMDAHDLLRVTTVLTPNLPELAALSGATISCHEEALVAARLLFLRLPRLRAVVVKGGHFTGAGEVVDHLVVASGQKFEVYQESHGRIDSNNTHGTGCTLASAFAAFHSLTGDYVSAFRESVRYLVSILTRSAPRVVIKNPQGHGPMLHFVRSYQE